MEVKPRLSCKTKAWFVGKAGGKKTATSPKITLVKSICFLSIFYDLWNKLHFIAGA